MTAHELNVELPGPTVTSFAVTPTVAVVALASTAPAAACPRCGATSRRVHSRYCQRSRQTGSPAGSMTSAG
jgi:hypothetical protein